MILLKLRAKSLYIIRGTIIILIFGSTALPAQANLLNSRDVTPFTHIVQQLLQLMTDINSASRMAKNESQECLMNMFSDIGQIHDEFQKIEEILYISTKMRLAEDEQFVNDTLRLDVGYAKKRLLLQREAINLGAGHCGNSSLVSEKSREALRLFSKANEAIELIASRLIPPR